MRRSIAAEYRIGQRTVEVRGPRPRAIAGSLSSLYEGRFDLGRGGRHLAHQGRPQRCWRGYCTGRSRCIAISSITTEIAGAAMKPHQAPAAGAAPDRPVRGAAPARPRRYGDRVRRDRSSPTGTARATRPTAAPSTPTSAPAWAVSPRRPPRRRGPVPNSGGLELAVFVRPAPLKFPLQNP